MMFHKIFGSRPSLNQPLGDSIASDLDSNFGAEEAFTTEFFPWLLVANNEYARAKAVTRKSNQHSLSLVEICLKFIDLLQNYHSFKWGTTPSLLQLLRKETTNLFDGICRVVSRLPEASSSAALSSPEADSLAISSVPTTLNAMLLVLRLRLALLDVYHSIPSPGSSTSSSSKCTDLFGDLVELATSICEFNKTCKPYANPVLYKISCEIALLWYISISHAAISKHEIMSAIMAFYCAKMVFRKITRQSSHSTSRLDTFLRDLYKKLNFKIGICFYKTLHGKELAMIQSLGQRTVRFHEDIRLPYLLPLLELYDSFKPLNMNILYLPNDSLKQEEGVTDENDAVDLSLLIKTHAQLFNDNTAYSSNDLNMDHADLFANSISCSKPQYAKSTENNPSTTSIFFKQGFECESIEKTKRQGLKSIPVVFSHPQDEVPLDYLPSIISLLLHFTRYPTKMDSASIAADSRLFSFSFASLPGGMSSNSPSSSVKYLPLLHQGLALAFIDRELDLCIVFARLDDDYLLSLVLRSVFFPPNNQKQVALTKVLQAIVRTFNPFLQ